MKFADLSTAARERIAAARFDWLVEKHEGPEHWGRVLEHRDVELLDIGGRQVLLPVDREHHPNITVLRCLVAEGDGALTLFLKDTTHVSEPDMETFRAGFVAVCERISEASVYVATLYHEWFILEN